jgi:hypothetical protein
MADTKISQELAAATLDGTELAEIVQIGNNRKTTTQSIANLSLARARIITKITDYSVLITDSGAFFDNGGASGEVDFLLPGAQPGLQFGFIVHAGEAVTVIAGGSANISLGTVSSEIGGNISSSSPYSIIHMIAVSTTEWVVDTSTGDWNIT